MFDKNCKIALSTVRKSLNLFTFCIKYIYFVALLGVFCGIYELQSMKYSTSQGDNFPRHKLGSIKM